MSPPKLPPRPNNLPRAVVGDEQPERDAVHHKGVDGVEQTPPRLTMLAEVLRAPQLPLEVARTVPAAAHAAPTIRVATPPPGIRATAEQDAPQGQPELATWPPPVMRSPSPVPSSSSSPEAKLDRAIGQTVRLVLARYGWPVLAALGIGGAVLKPAADPAKADATATDLAAVKREHALTREQLDGVLKREAQTVRYVECLESEIRDIGEQTLPAPDKMGTAQLPRPFVEKCSRLRP